MRQDIGEQLDKQYNYNVPEYIIDAGKTFIVIHVEGSNEKITINDVIEYYHTQARNITSGCRRLAGVVGDWRNIDYLAQECLYWFKCINKEMLRKEGKKRGMTLND